MSAEKGDETSVPELITPSMILDILKKLNQTDDVILVDFKTAPASDKGENWSSTLIRADFRAKIKGDEKEFHWIGKFPPASPERRVFHDASKMGEKEARGYAKFIPDLEKFIRDSGLENQIVLNFPKCPYADLDSPDFPFFMENMRELGYIDEFNKKLGLDEAHIKVTMDELAKFHAVGHAYVMAEAKKSSMEQVLKELDFYIRDFVFTEPIDAMRDVLKSFAEPARKGIYSNAEALANPGEDLVGPLKQYVENPDNPSHMIIKERRRDPDGFNVFIHDDAWFNNMLFKYELENGVHVPKKVSLVDIALYCWNSPVTDLSYFFYMSVHPDLRAKKEDEFLECYHNQLSKYLTLFGVDPSIYSLEQLKEEYNSKVAIGLMAALSSLPAVLLPKEQAIDQSDFDWSDLDAMMAKAYDLFKKAMAANPDIRERMRGNLLEGFRKGLLV